MIGQIPFHFELVISGLDDKHCPASIEPADGYTIHVLLEVKAGRGYEVL